MFNIVSEIMPLHLPNSDILNDLMFSLSILSCLDLLSIKIDQTVYYRPAQPQKVLSDRKLFEGILC